MKDKLVMELEFTPLTDAQLEMIKQFIYNIKQQVQVLNTITYRTDNAAPGIKAHK